MLPTDKMSHAVRKPTFWNIHRTKTQISLCVRAVWLESSLSAWRKFAPWLSQMCPVKILIRLRECAGWSETSQGEHFQRWVFWRWGRNVFLSVYLMLNRIYTNYSVRQAWANSLTNIRQCTKQRPIRVPLLQRRLNVDATSWRCIDVQPTLYKRHVPAGPTHGWLRWGNALAKLRWV